MAVVSGRDRGERDARVSERTDKARIYAAKRVGGDAVRRDVTVGKGHIKVDKLSGDGSVTETSDLSVVNNVTDGGGRQWIGEQPFPYASVKAQAIFYKPGDKEAVMAIAPIGQHEGFPDVACKKTLFYKATLGKDGRTWKQGEKIEVSPKTFANSPAEKSAKILDDAYRSYVIRSLVRQNMKNGVYEVGSNEPDKKAPSLKMNA